jgi:hypothetical protein
MGGDFEKYEGNLKGMNRMARVDGIDVILLCPSVETYQQHFWNYR